MENDEKHRKLNVSRENNQNLKRNCFIPKYFNCCFSDKINIEDKFEVNKAKNIKNYDVESLNGLKNFNKTKMKKKRKMKRNEIIFYNSLISIPKQIIFLLVHNYNVILAKVFEIKLDKLSNKEKYLLNYQNLNENTFINNDNKIPESFVKYIVERSLNNLELIFETFSLSGTRNIYVITFKLNDFQLSKIIIISLS